jgi:hypothetical protein
VHGMVGVTRKGTVMRKWGDLLGGRVSCMEGVTRGDCEEGVGAKRGGVEMAKSHLPTAWGGAHQIKSSSFLRGRG